MSEMLARGKRTDNGEWVVGFYVHLKDVMKDLETHRIYIYFSETDCGDFYPCWFEVDPATVGRCAGMPDKNGVEIFEGDFVRIDDDVKKAFNVTDGAVRYARGGLYVAAFGLLNSLNAIATFDCILRGEVIGNIHDNPELMEDEK